MPGSALAPVAAAAHKRPRDEEDAEDAAVEVNAEAVCVWGVLEALQAPSRENGLLAYAQLCFHVEDAVGHTEKTAAASMAGDDLAWASQAPGQAWLWQRVPTQLRHRYFPCPPVRNTGEPPTGEAAASTPEPLLPPRLLLPLCGTPTNNGAVSIGRLRSNDLVLATNPCVSSVHCSIACLPGSTRVQRAGDFAAADATATRNAGSGVDEDLARTEHAATAAMDRAVSVFHNSPTPTLTPATRASQGAQHGASAGPRYVASNAAVRRATAVPPHVVLSDYSTNGCLVRGQPVGKGRATELRDGDVVELINAGPRHTADYNLSFVFRTVDGFVRWMREAHDAPSTPEATGTAAAAAAASTPRVREEQHGEQQQRRRQQQQTAARRRALLCKAQWNVEAQVRRMYSHTVDEYYALHRAKPLGQGTFGTVYRAALLSQQPQQPQPQPQPEELPPHSSSNGSVSVDGAGGAVQVEHAFSTGAVVAWTANPAEEARLREAYIRERERRAPPTVVRVATTAAAAAAAAAAPSASVSAEAASYVFAVKVIRKQRMLVDALRQLREEQQQQQQQDDARTSRGVHGGSGGTDTGKLPAVSDAEAAVMEQLVLLETQPDELAAQRQAEWTAGALASLQLTDSLAEALSQRHMPAPEHGSDAEAALRWEERQPHERESREQQRRALLRCLPESLRRGYEKELQHRRRQQCETNILLAVRHPNVTALYEVFDQPDHLALVMEQATGGEVWDLLQAYKRRAVQRPAPQATRDRAVTTAAATTPTSAAACAKREDTAAEESDGDDDLVSLGGPLPEYLVKILVVQVLEAVLYLHTMGIIHRDLKLENLMLHRPCDRYALNALQLQMLVHQLRGLAPSSSTPAPANVTSTSSHAGGPADGADDEVEFTNPLSVLHTVHVPRHLWPVVKVMDFGLSRVLDQLRTRPTTATTNPSTSASDTLHGYAASEAVPERVRLIYSRNDATTSCGTPIYAAPEVTQPALRPDRVGYSAAVDMYSVGVIAYALLTGRAPFPSRRHPRRPDGPPVVDYDAPLRFQRRRRRPNVAVAAPASASVAAGAAPAPPYPHTAIALPPLAVVESVRVALPAEAPARTAAAADVTTSAQTQRWRQQAAAVAARVRRAEGERTGAVDAARHGTRAPNAPAACLFDATVAQLTASLTAYADGCAAAGREVDLDRLVHGALAAGQSAAESAGRVMGADGRVAEVALPPISALGVSFVRGLLEKYPTRRLTAYEALQHPWLRDCVGDSHTEGGHVTT